MISYGQMASSNSGTNVSPLLSVPPPSNLGQTANNHFIDANLAIIKFLFAKF